MHNLKVVLRRGVLGSLSFKETILAIVLIIDHWGKGGCRDTNQKSLALTQERGDSGQCGSSDSYEKWQDLGYILIEPMGFLMD